MDSDDKATAPKPRKISESLAPANQQVDEKTQAVANQTPDVVWGFLQEYDRAQSRRNNAGTPREQFFRSFGTQADDLLEVEQVVQASSRRDQLEAFSEVDLKNQANIQVARYLRRVAEDMEQTYRHTVITMVNKWLLELHRDRGGEPLTFGVVWTAFQKLIKTVLDSGITWGKILLLLLFAYEIAVALYIEGVPQFIRGMISSFVRYLIESPVMRWIAERGGWAAVATALWIVDVRSQIAAAAPIIAFISGIAMIALGAFLFTKRN